MYLLILVAIYSCHSPEQKQSTKNSSMKDSVYQESTKNLHWIAVLEKAPYLKKSERLTNADLYECVSKKFLNGEFVIDSLENKARKHLKMELITKDEFINERKNTISYLISDIEMFPKKNGITTLPFPGGNAQYVDVNPELASMREFYYRGHYNNPDLYLMYVQYYEAGCSYWLIDKSDSGRKADFPSLPIFTPDKKTIISVAFDPYSDSHCELKLCSINGSIITKVFQAEFVNWAPSAEEQGYMSSDGSFRIPVINSKFVWTRKGGLNKNYQYLKISIL